MILSNTIQATPTNNRPILSSSRLLLLSVAALAMAACKTTPHTHEEVMKAKITYSPKNTSQPKNQKLVTDNSSVEERFQFEDVTADIQKDLERDEKSRSMYVIMMELQKKLEKLHPSSQVKVDVQL